MKRLCDPKKDDTGDTWDELFTPTETWGVEEIVYENDSFYPPWETLRVPNQETD